MELLPLLLFLATGLTALLGTAIVVQRAFFAVGHARVTADERAHPGRSQGRLVVAWTVVACFVCFVLYMSFYFGSNPFVHPLVSERAFLAGSAATWLFGAGWIMAGRPRVLVRHECKSPK